MTIYIIWQIYLNHYLFKIFSPYNATNGINTENITIKIFDVTIIANPNVINRNINTVKKSCFFIIIQIYNNIIVYLYYVEYYFK